MISEDDITRTVDKMKLQNKYSIGNVYFDKLSLVCYEIVFNDNEVIKFRVPERGILVKVEANIIDSAYRKNLLSLMQCMN